MEPRRESPNTSNGYRTSPDQENTGWPPGIPYIVGNEACERFSYYGMRAILFAHLTALYVLAGSVAAEADKLATATTHLFFAGVYALPMIGAIVADRLLGKYKTILYLSLVYCVGQGVLAFVDLAEQPQHKLTVMYVGLMLIAIGSGGIKPCVSANVGDQFGRGNWFRVPTVYQIFYFSINLGSFFATLAIPVLRKKFGAGVAFALPAVLMLIATVIFWMGRRNFVHVPPRPGGKIGWLDTLCSVSLFMTVGHFFFTARMAWWVWVVATLAFLVLGLILFSWRQRLAPDHGFLAIMLYSIQRLFGGGGRAPAEDTSPSASIAADTSPLARSRFWGPAVQRFGPEASEGPVAVLKVISVFVLVSVFWALFDQHSSTWIRQAKAMDLTVFGSVKADETQVPAFNPLMVMAFIPLMNLVYAWFERRGIKTTTVRRMSVGMFLAALSFVSVALLQEWIDKVGEGKVWFLWQIIPYVIMTIAEVLVSTTGLEFAYTQAPKAMKSTVMGFWLLAVTLGNVLVALLAGLGNLSHAQFFWAWAAVGGVAAVLFAARSYFYMPKDYLQE